MADKTKKDEGATATQEKPATKLPCLGACRGVTPHDVEGKQAVCTRCENVRRTDVGAGSPAGPRWFVTKYPAWSTTLVPEDWIVHEGGRTAKQKPVRLVFKRIVKPRKLVSTDGELGSENPGGGDRNASRWLGVFAVHDPGPDYDKANKNDVLARQVVDFLRGHEYARKVVQDNRLPANPELIELSWDPTLRQKADAIAMSRRVTLDQNDEEAPDDNAPVAKRASIGLTRRPAPKPDTTALGPGE